MAKCPRCSSSAKPTGKEWDYGLFHVKQYICLECERKYMEYYRGGKLSHTIPRIQITPSNEKILKLLRSNPLLSCEEIAEKTGLNIVEVANILEELERVGLVQSAIY